METHLRALYDQLLAEGEAAIDRLIGERKQETVELDFKRKRDPSHGRFDDEDKRVYGKALSAFANSGGGLLIWGVNARKGDDGIDCAQAPGIPIAEIERFQSETIRFAGELLIPRHDGIIVERILSAKAVDSGYLLVQVERSERRPHRCEAKGEKQYFKRAGDSSFAMEHYDIEDAFRRISVPTLKLGIRFVPGARDGLGKLQRGNLQLYLQNQSSVTARMPYLQVINVGEANGGSTPGQEIILYTEENWLTYSGNASVAIHPGLSRTLVEYRLEFGWSSDHITTVQGVPAYGWSFAADCRFGCENSAAKAESIRLSEPNLVEMVRG